MSERAGPLECEMTAGRGRGDWWGQGRGGEDRRAQGGSCECARSRGDTVGHGRSS